MNDGANYEVKGRRFLAETQDFIASALTFDRKTVGASLRKLESVGLICFEKVKMVGANGKVYCPESWCCSLFKFSYPDNHPTTS